MVRKNRIIYGFSGTSGVLISYIICSPVLVAVDQNARCMHMNCSAGHPIKSFRYSENTRERDNVGCMKYAYGFVLHVVVSTVPKVEDMNCERSVATAAGVKVN